MRRHALIVLLAAAVAGPAACIRFAADDEVPIIVRGGSIDITGEEFAPDGTTDFTHKTARGDHKGKFWVKVIATNAGGDCTSVGSGNMVDVSYSDGFGIKFDIKQGGGTHTWIKPQGGRLEWDAGSKGKLRYPVQTGHISGVRSGGWNCTLDASSGLSEIRLCSSDTTNECQ